MMRRPSPPRISRSSPDRPPIPGLERREGVRRPPPPRNRGRRSPSGEDVKIIDWGAPGSGANLRQSRSDRPAERARSRSRSRERRTRPSGDHDRHRERVRDSRDNREFGRDLRDSRDSREVRDRDRDRNVDSSRSSSNRRLEEVKEKLHHVSKPLSFELQSYQQSFSGNSRFEPGSNGRFDSGSMHHLAGPVQEHYSDPSVGFRQDYLPIQEPSQIQSLNMQHSHLNYKAPELRPESVSSKPNRKSSIPEKRLPKVETPPEDDRVSRLEKLVEKLVETQATSAVQKSLNPQAEPFQPSYELDIYNRKELIPSNTKFTTSMWLNSLHEECLERGFDEKSCIHYVKSKMTGIIKAWFKTVENYDFTWPELKLLITKTFPDNVEFASTLRMLVEREKVAEETITQYFFSKVYLCEACKITGENAVSCLIDGLTNPFMKQDIRACNFLTPEVLFSEYFVKVPEHDHRGRTEGRTEREVETYQEYPPNDILMERERMYYQLELPSRELPGGPSRGGKPPSKKEKCTTCKKFGHSTFDCRHAPICYKCKERGHIHAKCPNFVGMLTFGPRHVWKIPCLTNCEIKGKQFLAQIDTGCSVVTIKESAVRELGLRIVNSNVKLFGYGGAMIKVSGAIHTKLKIDEVEDMMLLLVVPDQFQDFPLIVGQDFLNQRDVAVFIHQGAVRVFRYPVYYYEENNPGFGNEEE